MGRTLASDKVNELRAMFLAGTRVSIPDGRCGVLDKWPPITDHGLVKVNLENGGCFVCRLRDLRLEDDAPYTPQPPHIGGAMPRLAYGPPLES